MFRKDISFRRQIIVLCTICIILVMVTQLFYIISIFRRNYDQNRINCEKMITQTDSMLTLETDRITSIGKTVSNNKYIQELLRLNDQDKRSNASRRKDLINLLSNYLQGIINANDELYDIAIIDNTSSIFSSNRYFDYYVLSKIKQEYNLSDLKQPLFTTYFQSNTLEMYNYGFGYIVPVFYTTGNFSDIHERLGTCIVWIKRDVLNEIVDTTAANEEATVLITDDKTNIMAVHSMYQEEELSSEIAGILSDNNSELEIGTIERMKFMNRNSFVLMQEHMSTGWKTINIVPVNSIYSKSMETLYLGMYLAAGSILILIIFDFLLIYSISKPIKYFTAALDSIGKGERKKRIDYAAKNEFGIISESINNMLDNLEDMNRRIFDMQSKLYEKELMQKEAEMLALQSQINPHFLYNTLECIRSIATIHKIPEISIITTSMSKIFRYSIKGGLVTTIKEELECINDYYKIIAVRYNGRLKLTMEIDEALYPYTALKLSMQPIIENSVNHGLEASEEDIVISIKGWIDGEYAMFSLTDNGNGMEPEKERQLNDIFQNSTTEDIAEISKSKSSIGLANINMRIRMHYGKESGLNIHSTKNVGTTVIMKMRLEKQS